MSTSSVLKATVLAFTVAAGASVHAQGTPINAAAFDALAFVGMGMAPSLPVLYAFRVLDGAVHLPAVTLLMLASNRTSGAQRGGSLGALASA